MVLSLILACLIQCVFISCQVYFKRLDFFSFFFFFFALRTTCWRFLSKYMCVFASCCSTDWHYPCHSWQFDFIFHLFFSSTFHLSQRKKNVHGKNILNSIPVFFVTKGNLKNILRRVIAYRMNNLIGHCNTKVF